ncbi:Uncharacterised protein [uncultured archaeon]|nr:Uncharacterised protein [uncultured archaeon]
MPATRGSRVVIHMQSPGHNNPRVIANMHMDHGGRKNFDLMLRKARAIAKKLKAVKAGTTITITGKLDPKLTKRNK